MTERLARASRGGATPVAARPATDAYALARDWIADCCWGDLEPDEVAALRDEHIRLGVERHYEGGWTAFLADAGYELVAASGPRSRISALAA